MYILLAYVIIYPYKIELNVFILVFFSINFYNSKKSNEEGRKF